MNRGPIAVFGSSQTIEGSSEWLVAEGVGRRVALAGHPVITGGYGGTMEAASKGAAEQGGHVIGVTSPSLFPGRTGANPYVEELIETSSLMDRIAQLIERSSGVIALPGSIGTATELLVAWNHNFLLRRRGKSLVPTVAVGPGWQALTAVMIDQMGAEPGDIHLAGQAEEALDWLFARI